MRPILPAPPIDDYDPQNEREFRREIERIVTDLGEKTSTVAEVTAITATFQYDGQAKVTVTGNGFTQSIRCAISTSAYPTTAAVQAVTAVNGASADFTFVGPYVMGNTIYLSALAYSGADGSGSASEKKNVLVTVSTIQPTLLVTVDQTTTTGNAVSMTVKITDPAGLLTGNALTTITWAGIASLYGDTLVQSIPTPTAINLTIGATYVFTATVNSNTTTGGYIKFSATKTPGAYSGLGYWFGAGSLAYLGCYAQVTAVSATQITVTVTSTSISGSPTVGLVGITGLASRSSGRPAVNAGSGEVGGGVLTWTQNGTDNVWVFDRPAVNAAGIGQVQFRTMLSGFIQDDDFVDIPEVGRDTIYLAMRARVTASTATTATVRVSVADPYPQGAASVTVAYSEVGGTGTACSPVSGGTITPAATLTEAAGTYIDYTVTRPNFGTGTRRVTFTASTTTGSGFTIRVSDSDAVDIPAVEKLAFGPTLDVNVTPGASTYTITWTGTAGTTVSIDGSGYGTPGASPISVARNAANGADKTYSFKSAVVDSQTITDVVTIPAIGAVDTNTVACDLSVVPNTPAPTTQPYIVTATNPTGGAAPTLKFRMKGCTASGYADDTEYTITTGAVITVNRPVSTTTTQAHIRFWAYIAGGTTEEIDRTVPTQQPIGPSLLLTPTENTTTVDIAYTATGTLTYDPNVGSYSTPPASPITGIARNASGGATKRYTFRCVADGQTVGETVQVRPQDASSYTPPDNTAVVDRVWVSAVDYTTNEVTVSWSYTGTVGTGTFEVLRVKTVSATPDLSGTATSIATVSPSASPASFADAVPDDITTGAGPKVSYSYTIRSRDAAAATLRTSTWMSATYTYV